MLSFGSNSRTATRGVSTQPSTDAVDLAASDSHDLIAALTVIDLRLDVADRDEKVEVGDGQRDGNGAHGQSRADQAEDAPPIPTAVNWASTARCRRGDARKVGTTV